MTDLFRTRCELLIANREAVSAAFPWSDSMTRIACANLYAMRGRQVDPAVLKAARETLRKHVGLFSNFRGLSEDLLAAVLELSGSPEAMLARALEIYDRLKKIFYSSTYLPMTALTIARMVQPEDYDAVCTRIETLFRRMKQEHPWLTGADDSAMCALMAISGRETELLITRMEACYQLLKDSFFGNSLQTLTHVLTLLSDTPELICPRVLALYDAFKSAGHKWGRSYELPLLGVLATDPRPADLVVADVVACDDQLDGQKGFGVFSISRTLRLMFAGILTQQDSSAAEITSMTGVIAAAIAQEAALTCTIAASVAATTAASSAH